MQGPQVATDVSYENRLVDLHGRREDHARDPFLWVF
jgi:hypothetical protein